MEFKEIYRGMIENETRNTYHGWPTVANMGNDKLVAVASGNRAGHVCPFGRVFLYESTDKGRTWTGPRSLTNGPLDDRDAGIGLTPAGTWLVQYFTSAYFAEISSDRTPAEMIAVQKNISLDTLVRENGFFMLRSTDQGKTWSEKYSIPMNNVHGHIVLSDGSLFLHGKARGVQVAATTHSNDVVAVRSTDDGLTWQEIHRIAWGKCPGFDLRYWHELTSIQADDGTIITHIRMEDPQLPIGTWQITSTDQGRSWSEPRFITRGFPAHLLKLQDGRLLTSYGYRDKISGNRARISSDNGQTWSDEYILSDGSPTGDLGYPSTAQFADGSLFTLWYQYLPEKSTSLLHYLHWAL